ncbi:MAG TPA: hypothetical protein VEF07_07515 [Candidatus Binataceae bacterium]|nr:hypothetical protein [Candidatus Binataceae bacterium]
MAALVCAAGCGSHADEPTGPTTRVTFATEPEAAPIPSTAAGADTNAAVQANIDRFFGSNPEQARYGEAASRPPGGASLGNDKARRFGDFSYVLARRTLAAAQDLEPDKLEQRKMRDDLRQVILTAVLDQNGRLTEIIVGQHSGDRAVDEIFIAACKKALWSRNPPLEARADDGNYRLRIDGRITNYSFDRYGKYTYRTELELSLL